MDMTQMTANELMLWNIANLWKEEKEGARTVRHEGVEPVRDFGRPRRIEGIQADDDHFEQALPCLFPYGEKV